MVGETPNLAARLQASPAGAIVIAAATRRLVGALFDAATSARRGQRIADAVQAWQVLVRDARRAASRLRGPALTPLVGRDEEIDLLCAAGRRPRPARDGWC